MARTEYECRILNIDLEKFLSKLESLDAEDKGEKLQQSEPHGIPHFK